MAIRAIDLPFIGEAIGSIYGENREDIDQVEPGRNR